MGRDAAAGRSTGRGDRGNEWVKRKDFSAQLCPHSRPEGLGNLTAVVCHKALACCPFTLSFKLGCLSPPRNEDGDFFFFRASFSPNLWRCWELLFPWKPSRQPRGGGVGQPPPPLRLRSLRSLALARRGPKLRITPPPPASARIPNGAPRLSKGKGGVFGFGLAWDPYQAGQGDGAARSKGGRLLVTAAASTPNN